MATAAAGGGQPQVMPGDNPVYETGNTTLNELKGGSLAPHTTAAVTILPDQQEFEGIESSVKERKFDNPIYGDHDINERDDHDDIDDVYMTPIDQQDQQSLPDHEFDNPIYGAETYDS